MQTNRPKVGLALSGGSALGNVHIGVLQSFQDHKIPIDCISGTSAGAIVAACYAFGVPVEDMVDKTKSLSWYKISNLSYSRMGLITTDNIGRLTEELIGKVNIEDAKIPLAIIATDIESGEPVVFKKGNLSQAIMASVCIPGLFVPIEVNGRQLVDGGLVENLPLSPLQEMGAEIRIGVDLSRWRNYKKPTSVIDVMLNSLDIMTHTQTKEQAGRAEILIEPHLEKYTSSDFKKAVELAAEGYRAATLALPAINNALYPQPSVKEAANGNNNFFKKIVAWFKE